MKVNGKKKEVLKKKLKETEKMWKEKKSVRKEKYKINDYMNERIETEEEEVDPLESTGGSYSST